MQDDKEKFDCLPWLLETTNALVDDERSVADRAHLNQEIHIPLMPAIPLRDTSRIAVCTNGWCRQVDDVCMR